jgi:hypothetical protein
MTERTEHDDALIDEIDAVRRDLVALDIGPLSQVWAKLLIIDAPTTYRAQVAERCLASAQRLTELAQNLVKPGGGE